MQVSGYSSATAYSSMQQTRPPKPDPEKMYSDADSDGSGGLSVDEFKSFFQKAKEMGPPPDAPEGAQQPPELSDEQIEEMFTEADTDGDGVLSSEEFSAHMESMRPRNDQVKGMMEGGATTSIEEEVANAKNSSFTALLEMLNSNTDDEESSSTIADYLTQLIQKAYGTGEYATTGVDTTSTISATV